MGSEYRPII